MITLELEYFTVEDAIDAGLVDAIRRGETKLGGRYECDTDGRVVFKQQKFAFNDKRGNLRVGRFVDDDAVADFIELSRTGAI